MKSKVKKEQKDKLHRKEESSKRPRNQLARGDDRLRVLAQKINHAKWMLGGAKRNLELVASWYQVRIPEEFQKIFQVLINNIDRSHREQKAIILGIPLYKVVIYSDPEKNTKLKWNKIHKMVHGANAEIVNPEIVEFLKEPE